MDIQTIIKVGKRHVDALLLQVAGDAKRAEMSLFEARSEVSGSDQVDAEFAAQCFLDLHPGYESTFWDRNGRDQGITNH